MASPPKTELPVKKNAFVHKLYDMLNNKLIAHLIWWADTPEANTFLLCPNKEFSEALRNYFKHENVASFVRQLHMYGFHKVSDPTPITEKGIAIWEFRHSSGKFRKNDEASLVFIKRRLQLNLLSSQLDPFGTNGNQHPYDMNRVLPGSNGQAFYNFGFQQQQYAVQYIPVSADGPHANYASMREQQGIFINPQTGAAMYHNQPMQIVGQIPQQQFPGYAYFPGHGMVPLQGPPPGASQTLLQVPANRIQDQHPGHNSIIEHSRFTSQGPMVMQPHLQGYEATVNNHVFTQYHNNSYPPILAPVTGAPTQLPNHAQSHGPGGQHMSVGTLANEQRPGLQGEAKEQITTLPAISKQLPQPILTANLLQSSLMTTLNSSDSRSSVDQDNLLMQAKDDRTYGTKDSQRLPKLSSRPSWDRGSYLLQESVTPISAFPGFPKDPHFGESIILRPLENLQPAPKDSIKLELPRSIFKQSPLPSISEAVHNTNMPLNADQKELGMITERSGSSLLTPSNNNTSFSSSEPSSAVSAAFPPDNQMPKLPMTTQDGGGAQLQNTVLSSRNSDDGSVALQSPPRSTAMPKPAQRSRGIASHLLNDDNDELENRNSEEAENIANEEVSRAPGGDGQVKSAKLEHLLEDTDSEERKKPRRGTAQK